MKALVGLLTATFICLGLFASPVEAGTKFQRYEAVDKVFTGTGGMKSTKKGIDFWETGDPPRKFEILGSLTDKRASRGLFSLGLKSKIAKKAKEHGGDAVILLGAQDQAVGVVGNSWTYKNGNHNSYSTFGSGGVVSKTTRTYMVVKYVD